MTSEHRKTTTAIEGVTIVEHPLVQHKLGLLRDKDLSTKSFRDLPQTEVEIETPMRRTSVKRIAGKKLVFAPILRAGLAFMQGMLDLVPTARIAHVGMYRDPGTLVAVEYFFKAPTDLAERLVIVVAPMLATGNTAVAAIDRLKEHGATAVRLACIVAAPEGIERLRGLHPDVRIWTAAVDERLDDDAFIVPGFGDAGDRAYGTK